MKYARGEDKNLKEIPKKKKKDGRTLNNINLKKKETNRE